MVLRCREDAAVASREHAAATRASARRGTRPLLFGIVVCASPRRFRVIVQTVDDHFRVVYRGTIPSGKSGRKMLSKIDVERYVGSRRETKTQPVTADHDNALALIVSLLVECAPRVITPPEPLRPSLQNSNDPQVARRLTKGP